jgi:hypothetical protein
LLLWFAGGLLEVRYEGAASKADLSQPPEDGVGGIGHAHPIQHRRYDVQQAYLNKYRVFRDGSHRENFGKSRKTLSAVKSQA